LVKEWKKKKKKYFINGYFGGVKEKKKTKITQFTGRRIEAS